MRLSGGAIAPEQLLVVDAGPLFAAAARRDPDHTRCRRLLTKARGPLIVPDLVVTEVAYLLADRIGPEAEIQFGRSVAGGELVAEPLQSEDWARVVELAERYVDLPLGLVDAAVVAVAERLAATTIATLDRSHFSVVRPRHTAAFRLVP